MRLPACRPLVTVGLPRDPKPRGAGGGAKRYGDSLLTMGNDGDTAGGTREDQDRKIARDGMDCGSGFLRRQGGAQNKDCHKRLAFTRGALVSVGMTSSIAAISSLVAA